MNYDKIVLDLMQLRDFQAEKANTSSGQRVKLATGTPVITAAIKAIEVLSGQAKSGQANQDDVEVLKQQVARLETLLDGRAPEGYITTMDASDVICFATASKSRNRAQVEINQGRLQVAVLHGVRLVVADSLDTWLQSRGYEPLEVYLRED